MPAFADCGAAGLSANYQLPSYGATLLLQVDNIATCVSGFSTPPVAGISPASRATYTARHSCGLGLHHEILNMPAVGTMVFLGTRYAACFRSSSQRNDWGAQRDRRYSRRDLTRRPMSFPSHLSKNLRRRLGEDTGGDPVTWLEELRAANEQSRADIAALGRAIEALGKRMDDAFAKV